MDSKQREGPEPRAGGSAGRPAGPPSHAELSGRGSVAALVARIDSRLVSTGGLAGLAAWLDELGAALAKVDAAELERLRSDLRSAIDEVMEMNAELQRLLKLKRTLS